MDYMDDDRHDRGMGWKGISLLRGLLKGNDRFGG